MALFSKTNLATACIYFNNPGLSLDFPKHPTCFFETIFDLTFYRLLNDIILIRYKPAYTNLGTNSCLTQNVSGGSRHEGGRHARASTSQQWASSMPWASPLSFSGSSSWRLVCLACLGFLVEADEHSHIVMGKKCKLP